MDWREFLYWGVGGGCCYAVVGELWESRRVRGKEGAVVSGGIATAAEEGAREHR